MARELDISIERRGRPKRLRLRHRHGADQHGDPEVVRGEPRDLALHCAGQPQQNAFAESFIGRLRDECLNETPFVSLALARAVLDAWRADYNGVRPPSVLANRTPEEFRAHHLAVAASVGNGQNFSPGLSS